MNLALAIALPVMAIALLLVAVAAIRHGGTRWGWNPEIQRKLVHVTVGLFSLSLPALFAHAWQVVLLLTLAVGAMIALRASGGRLGAIGRAVHSVERRSFGDIWLALAVGFLYLRAQGNYVEFGLPLAIITLSDAAAALTGSTYGRRRFAADGGVKSWEGVIAFVMVGWIVAMSMLLLFSDVGRANVILLGFIIATFGAMVEAVSWRGLDNLFVPLAIQFFLKGFLGAGPIELSLLAALFFSAGAASSVLAQWLRQPSHVMRAFVVALFVFVGVGEMDGAIFPIAAMAIYLAGDGVYWGKPLDFLGTLCGCALIWFFLGETAGPSAIHFYNVAMAGIALAYTALALEARGRRVATLLAAGAYYLAVIAIAHSGLVHTATPPRGLETFAAVSLALMLAATLARPVWFHRWRAPRIALLASLVPLIAYGHALWSR